MNTYTTYLLVLPAHKTISIRVNVIMPLFELITNVKEVPANFHKETTEFIASQLGKPSSVSVVNLATFVELS